MKTEPFLLPYFQAGDDFTDDDTTTGILELGGTSLGRIDFENDRDWFAFTVKAGDIVSFDNSLGAWMSIYYSPAFSHSRNNRVNEPVLFEEAGTYYISMSFPVVGNYTISASEASRDDYSDDRTTTTGVIDFETVTTGRIDHSDDIDWFLLTLEEGDLIEFDTSLDSIRVFGPEWGLYGTFETGEVFGSERSVTYFVEARSQTIGDYTIGVEKIEGITLVGDGGADYLFGTWGVDTLIGNAGNDHLRGGAENDLLNGGDGRDYLLGEDGNDRLLGGRDNDTLDGGRGDDDVFGGSGNDIMRGGIGHDLMDGGVGNDLMFGGSGNDIMFGSFGDDRMDGGAGNDEMNGDNGRDYLIGNLGHDLLRGGSGNDVLDGGDGDDTLFGQNDDDILRGGAGEDFLNGGNGDDFLIGGGGNDLLIGGNNNDRLLGGSGDDTLFGGGGSDILDGGAGFNTVYGGGGADRFDRSGDGTDRIMDFQASDRIVISSLISDFDDLLDNAVDTSRGVQIANGDDGFYILTGFTVADLRASFFEFEADAAMM